MSTKQHPGGVAGKLIDEIRVHYKAAEDDETAQAHGNQMAGVIALHEELSREARAILAECDSYIIRVESDTEMNTDEKDEVLCESITEKGAQRRAFERLGLDLESEDE